MAVHKTPRSVPHVVIVATDASQRQALTQLADAEGAEVTLCGSVEEARAALARARSTAAEAAGDSIEVPVPRSRRPAAS
jgi:hypothetical protein